MAIFKKKKKKSFGNFFGKSVKFLAIFLTVKWQFSGRSASDHRLSQHIKKTINLRINLTLTTRKNVGQHNVYMVIVLSQNLDRLQLFHKLTNLRY